VHIAHPLESLFEASNVTILDEGGLVHVADVDVNAATALYSGGSPEGVEGTSANQRIWVRHQIVEFIRRVPPRACISKNGEFIREESTSQELQKVNPSVRPEEIGLLVEQRRALDRRLLAARLRLDAIRLIERGP